MKLKIGLLALFLAFPALSLADVVGVWAMKGGGQFKVSYKDDAHIRMDVEGGNYVLMAGAKTYMVMNQGGNLMAMDMDQMSGMMQSLGGMMNQQMGQVAKDHSAEDVSFKKTGKTETVSGYKGDVYRVEVKTARGVEAHEMVWSNHSDIANLQKAFAKMGERMAKIVQNPEMTKGMNFANQQVKLMGAGGALRYDQDMVIQSVEKKSVPNSAYELPPGTSIMQIPAIPGMMGR